MSESAHDFDILMNDGSTRSMSHYKEKFSSGLFPALKSYDSPRSYKLDIEFNNENLKKRDPQFLLWTLPPYEV